MKNNLTNELNTISYLRKFEVGIVTILLGMMVFVVFLSTIRLGWTIYSELLKSSTMLLNSEQLFKIFGFILMILLGLELIGSIKAYITADEIHLEVVFTIALISLAKIIITTDLVKLDGFKLVGIASVVLSLSLGYFLIKKIHKPIKVSRKDPGC